MQLLATKTQIPAVRPTLIVRHDLLQQLDGALASGAGLFLVSAPAGYGKTTLIAHWFAHLRGEQTATTDAGRRIHCAWLALDSSDNDPACFLSYLSAALQTAVTASDRRHDPAAAPVGRQARGAVLPRLVNDIAALARPVLLVLDDYHHITAQSVHDLVAALLEFMPPNLHIAIVTRVDPPLPLARLRGRGQVVELRQSDLRFSTTEAAQFLHAALETPLSPEHVAALTSRTEGWIAGLQMAAVSLRGRTDVAEFIAAFAGSHRHILDYLSEEVYRSQPEKLRRFLVRTAVLERFDAQLCAAIMAPETPGVAGLEAQEAQHILEHLEHANLFVVPLDDDRRWYRYHQLFADLLRLRLAQEEPDVATRLHLRASEWFEQQNLIDDAIHHALAAQQYERAAGLMERTAEMTMMDGAVTTLRTWLGALPSANLRSHPLLCIYEASALLLAGETSEQAETLLRDALQRDHAPVDGPMAVYLALAAAYAGRDAASQRLAQHALTLLPEHSPFFRSFATLLLALGALVSDDDAAFTLLREAQAISDRVGSIMNSVLARCHLAELYVQHNLLETAAALYSEALALADELSHPDAARGFPLIGLGLIHYDRNELLRAQRCLEQGIQLNQDWGALGGILGRAVLARVCHALGDRERAAALTLEIEASLVHSHGPLDAMGRYVLLQQAHAAFLVGDGVTAARLARAAGVDPDDVVIPSTTPTTITQDYELLVQAQILQARGDAQAALHALKTLQQQAARQGRERLVVQALLEQALLQHRGGHASAAVDALEAALGLAAASGAVRLIVDGGPPVADLLRLALRRGCQPEFAVRLLAAFPPPQGIPAPGAAPLPAAATGGVQLSAAALPLLSQRELEVLDLVAQGLTNQEIAERLIVAVSTVKTHLNHICAKLDAPNRTAAVTSARHLHLLSSP